MQGHILPVVIVVLLLWKMLAAIMGIIIMKTIMKLNLATQKMMSSWHMLFNNNYHNSQLQKPPHLQINGRKIYSYLLTHMTGVAILWESDQEDEDDGGPSSICSSSEKNSYCGDEWLYSWEEMDECADGEVGKRLNQMIPIPHVPRTNGEIPSVDEATLDHQRLLDRLQMYELVESKVEGDGSCQFRALSDQIYRTSEHHKFVREQIVNQLKSYPEKYEGYVPMAYGDYIEKMSNIFVITSFKDTCCIEILPNFERSKRVICLSFWAEVHYNSIYPEGDYCRSAC
ncbi:uncharacterized protein LOC114716168 isoform X10 [Neltuma alba]|uniref:uncharacterized protein LOC114716168 isoform X10 n=1 Tax=Neltuma alba TaxID=207710 RepID=UPI0010A396BF|nr:uncharacterized protein LOC114716168 isoform X10 [Prosopis alba]